MGTKIDKAPITRPAPEMKIATTNPHINSGTKSTLGKTKHRNNYPKSLHSLQPVH